MFPCQHPQQLLVSHLHMRSSLLQLNLPHHFSLIIWTTYLHCHVQQIYGILSYTGKHTVSKTITACKQLPSRNRGLSILNSCERLIISDQYELSAIQITVKFPYTKKLGQYLMFNLGVHVVLFTFGKRTTCKCSGPFITIGHNMREHCPNSVS